MSIHKSGGLLTLARGDLITKRNLADLIQYSKVENSEYWDGPSSIIGNTPQQGINWIGVYPNISAVIIKTKSGAYAFDGWQGEDKRQFRYSFKAGKGVINLREKANSVLINQPQTDYPILLFIEAGRSWVYEGSFRVSGIAETYVDLIRMETGNAPVIVQDSFEYREGRRRYATHLRRERSTEAVSALKALKAWICEICSENFADKYGIKYIEAHHKIPIGEQAEEYHLKLSDLALLCPNCHKAVHVYMKQKQLEFEEIKKLIQSYNSVKSS